MGIVVNACKDRIRSEVHRRKRQEAVAPELVSEQPQNAEHSELLAASLRMVKALPEHYRLPVSLHFLDGLSFKEIGEALQISLNTAASRTRYALETLRKVFNVR